MKRGRNVRIADIERQRSRRVDRKCCGAKSLRQERWGQVEQEQALKARDAVREDGSAVMAVSQTAQRRSDEGRVAPARRRRDETHFIVVQALQSEDREIRRRAAVLARGGFRIAFEEGARKGPGVSRLD